MKKQIVSLLSALAATVALLGPAPASATVVSSDWQSASFSFDSVNASANLSFNGFNSSLGTLLGVVIKFSLNEVLNDLVFNFSNNVRTIGSPNAVSATSTITASGPLGLTAVNQLTTPGFSGSVGVNGPYVIGTTSVTDLQVGPAQINGNPTTLASYIGGTNSVTINVNGVGTQAGSLADSVFTSYQGTSSGVVYLQYIYAIPEPAAMAVFALGLLLMSALMWRRRQR